jgi:hypothetical protein
MFYIADAYTSVTSVWAATNLMAGRRIPMPINTNFNLKFYLYGSHTFATSDKLGAEW